MLELERLHESPAGGLGALIAESEAAGLRFVRRLAEEWASGANRFDRPGEALLVARIAGDVVGVCGLNVDPYVAEPRVGRVRHLYVLAAHRRQGVGRQLVNKVIETARDRFERLRLRTVNPEAARLYENLGFRRSVGGRDCTHVMELSAAVQAPGAPMRITRKPGEPVPAPAELVLGNPANAGLRRYRESTLRPGMAAVTSPEAVARPYDTLGTHPDLVARLWDELGAALPVDCRAIFYGAPALIHPVTGTVFGFAGGTHTYALRLPGAERLRALQLGAARVTHYPSGASLDLDEIGEEWMFCRWYRDEEAWCRAAYEHAGRA
jgi:GNAT superfamily N-acetyltransferase